MLRKLLPESLRMDSTREFYSLKQGNGQSVEEFGFKVKKVAKQGNISDKMALIEVFLNGLKWELRKMMSTERPRSFEAAVRLTKRCKLIEEDEANGRWRRLDMDIDIVDIRQTSERKYGQQDAIGSEIKCFGWGLAGHFIRDCPTKSRTTTNRNQQQRSQYKPTRHDDNEWPRNHHHDRNGDHFQEYNVQQQQIQAAVQQQQQEQEWLWYQRRQAAESAENQEIKNIEREKSANNQLPVHQN
jgi:hypothetical protein